MRKKRKRVFGLAALFLAGTLAGCGAFGKQPAETETAAVSHAAEETTEPETVTGATATLPDQKEELRKDLYGDYQSEGGEIAFVSDGAITDAGFNEALFDGVQMYALGAGVSFSYYLAQEGDTQSHRDAIEHAVQNQARVIVCAGYAFGEAVGELQKVYPEVSFLMIDGVPTDGAGTPVKAADNVHCVTFREEEAGYLAGYLTVLEGYRRLGFCGGEEDPSVVRYGYGYLQGIDGAVQELGLTDVTVDYWYAGSYQPEAKIRQKAAEWYDGGTEVIFACGGLLYESVLEAAEEKDGLLIGVDVDQSVLSERFLTSAVKDLSNAVVISLDDYYAAGGVWSETFAGQTVCYGAAQDCTGLPVLGDGWRFSKVTVEDYFELYKRIVQGEIEISDDAAGMPQVSFPVRMEAAGK